MTQIEQIKAEIERRIKGCRWDNGRIKPPRTRNAICQDELTDLLNFINSLPEEPSENSGQLELHPYNGDEGNGYTIRLNGYRIIIIKDKI